MSRQQVTHCLGSSDAQTQIWLTNEHHNALKTYSVATYDTWLASQDSSLCQGATILDFLLRYRIPLAQQ